MKIGLTIWGPEVGVRETVDLAVQAEQEGWDSAFMVEGVFSNDALTTVAGMAGRTSRLTIGTGIANVYLRHPVMLALSAATIDELSGGRLVLGLGPSSEAMITRAGLPWRDQRLALLETTETARRVFAGQGLAGLRAPRAATRPVPIHWAAVALETCEAAGRLADGLMLYLCSTGRYHQAVARMARGAGAANRLACDVSVSVLIPTFLHEDLAAAQNAAREFLIFYASLPHYAKALTASGFGAEMERVATALAAGDRAGATGALSDRLLDEIVLAGPAARCRDQLARFRDAGVECALLGPQRVGDRDVATQARTLVRDLAPARG